MGDLGNTVLGTYDTGQTNRVSSCLGSGVPARWTLPLERGPKLDSCFVIPQGLPNSLKNHCAQLHRF
jgi:hypothetical protein